MSRKKKAGPKRKVLSVEEKNKSNLKAAEAYLPPLPPPPPESISVVSWLFYWGAAMMQVIQSQASSSLQSKAIRGNICVYDAEARRKGRRRRRRRDTRRHGAEIVEGFPCRAATLSHIARGRPSLFYSSPLIASPRLSSPRPHIPAFGILDFFEAD